MDYKRLIIRGISYSQTQSGAYALLLEHEETNAVSYTHLDVYKRQQLNLSSEKLWQSEQTMQ